MVSFNAQLTNVDITSNNTYRLMSFEVITLKFLNESKNYTSKYRKKT